ncbi:MAG TPA: poly-gamma-glutamate biosynthesis protein PgsC [Spirochaetota bacterium]|nr:poly-gamma-glutamate biosynthesis protein PgsC [Spirochaetota bacterium]HPC40042.1 poly-gamma-glutamate biosynthesis protein PgsC [Spirochaetota bacterium]HPL15212.1 poly-gamma-glutamate biosynthesis protein PgsC [Spirochaetota bacterium]HQF09922.1 poly-gamma-glutamate biosynthesis protein PgsC [Spirochaetota bacterium]HQH98573.1 poly-gamma-glutamate biosynthesis protein PgsC [Spirochaetota bacterium]
MENIITLSIGLGLCVSLLFSEFFGIAAGGMVVPGYIALYLNRPLVIIATALVSLLTYFIVNSLGSFMIIYGRRRTVLMILLGFLLGWLVRTLEPIPLGPQAVELSIVGYIIPGLIAIWLDRQGIIETMAALITSSAIVRLILILFFGRDMSL